MIAERAGRGRTGACRLRADRDGPAACAVFRGASRRVRTIAGLGPRVFYQITDSDAARVVRGVALAAEVRLARTRGAA